MLIIFGGLPATGKSTLSRRLATELQAVYVRVDTIEQALRDEGYDEIHTEGYVVAYKFAADNLTLGSTVIADSVNSVRVTREAWRSVGHTAEVPVIEIEIICSDQSEHEQRLETRIASIDRLVQPTWDEVVAREYEPWTQAQVVVDTAGESPEQSFKKALSLIQLESNRRTVQSSSE